MSGEILVAWFGTAIASAVVSAVVAKATTVKTLEKQNAVLEEREENHYNALDRKIDATAAALNRRIDDQTRYLDQKLDLVLKAVKS